MTWSASSKELRSVQSSAKSHLETCENNFKIQTQSDLAGISEISPIFFQNIGFKDLQASSPILTSPGLAYVKNTLGGQANVTDTNAIPWSKTLQKCTTNHINMKVYTRIIKDLRKVNEKSMKHDPPNSLRKIPTCFFHVVFFVVPTSALQLGFQDLE